VHTAGRKAWTIRIRCNRKTRVAPRDGRGDGEEAEQDRMSWVRNLPSSYGRRLPFLVPSLSPGLTRVSRENDSYLLKGREFPILLRRGWTTLSIKSLLWGSIEGHTAGHSDILLRNPRTEEGGEKTRVYNCEHVHSSVIGVNKKPVDAETH